MRTVEKPRVKATKPEIGNGVWAPETANAFLENPEVKKAPQFALYHCMFYTGARIGELMDLHREDLDLRNGTMRIRATLVDGTRNDTKSTTGDRTISLSQTDIRVLTHHYARLMSEGLGGTVMVFPSDVGTYLLHSNFLRKWTELIAQAGLDYVVPHSARHMHASVLIGSGVDMATAAKRLGHTATTMMSTYVHSMPKKDQAAADGFEKIMQGGGK